MMPVPEGWELKEAEIIERLGEPMEVIVTYTLLDPLMAGNMQFNNGCDADFRPFHSHDYLGTKELRYDSGLR